jgi:hypothetical protein
VGFSGRPVTASRELGRPVSQPIPPHRQLRRRPAERAGVLGVAGYHGRRAPAPALPDLAGRQAGRDQVLRGTAARTMAGDALPLHTGLGRPALKDPRAWRACCWSLVVRVGRVAGAIGSCDSKWTKNVELTVLVGARVASPFGV